MPRKADPAERSLPQQQLTGTWTDHPLSAQGFYNLLPDGVCAAVSPTRERSSSPSPCTASLAAISIAGNPAGRIPRSGANGGYAYKLINAT